MLVGTTKKKTKEKQTEMTITSLAHSHCRHSLQNAYLEGFTALGLKKTIGHQLH